MRTLGSLLVRVRDRIRDLVGVKGNVREREWFGESESDGEGRNEGESEGEGCDEGKGGLR